MSAPYIPGLPGIRAIKRARHKVIFKGGYVPDILPQGKIIDGTASRDPSNTDTILVLGPGLLMGKITSSGKYAPSIIGVTLNAEVAGSTAIEVSSAVATEIVRRIGSTGSFKLTGPPVANGVTVTETVTYSSINTGTGVITCTALANAFVAGSFVQPTDGSEVPVTFIPDGFGVPLAELDGTVVANVQFPEMPIAGLVDSSELTNWPSDTSLQNWLVTRLRDANGSNLIFDHKF
jgi:hypothetical protein